MHQNKTHLTEKSSKINNIKHKNKKYEQNFPILNITNINYSTQLNPQASQFTPSRQSTTTPINSPTKCNSDRDIHLISHITTHSSTSSLSSMTIGKMT